MQRQEPDVRGVSRRTVHPSRMAPDERARFARELYRVHARIFSGVSFEEFVAHVVEPPAELTAIQVFHGAGGALVGYCAFHRFVRRIQGRHTIVLRLEAGLLPEYRGKAMAHWFGMLGALKEKLRHPLARVMYLGTLVHPSSYRFFCKYFPVVFPRRNQHVPPRIHALAVALADSFADPPSDPTNPMVRDVGWVTIETLEHPAMVSRHARADIEFFEVENPGYGRGDGLVVVVPVTLVNVGTAIGRRLVEIAHGWLRRRQSPL